MPSSREGDRYVFGLCLQAQQLRVLPFPRRLNAVPEPECFENRWPTGSPGSLA